MYIYSHEIEIIRKSLRRSLEGQFFSNSERSRLGVILDELEREKRVVGRLLPFFCFNCGSKQRFIVDPYDDEYKVLLCINSKCGSTAGRELVGGK